MRRLLACLLALTCLCAACALAEEAQDESLGNMVVYNCNEWVSLRKSPGTSSARLAKVPLGASVTDCTRENDDFIRCTYNGETGYVLSEYLTPLYAVGDLSMYVTVKYEDDCEALTVTCLDANGVELWCRVELNAPYTELEGTCAFVAGTAENPLVMLYAANTGLIAADIYTGSTLWTLTTEEIDLGGSISWSVAEDGTMYVGGFYGPDPVAISMDGQVLWQAGVNNTDMYWLYEIEIREDGIAAHYDVTDGMGGTPGWALYDFDGNFISLAPD